MPTVKRVYREPLVRAQVERLRFPAVCPVCGESATTTALVRLTPGQKSWLRPIDDPGFLPGMRVRLGIQPPETIVFRIPVCEAHQYSDQTYTKLNTVLVCVNGLSLALLIISTIFAVEHHHLYGVLPTWYIEIALLALLSLGGSLFILGRRPLPRALRFIGMDPSHRNVLIAIRDPQYRDRLIAENPGIAELVNWILIA